MAKKENAEKSIVVANVKLYDKMTRETIVIADDELVNYDVRRWEKV
jgi:hypothetical protein